MSPAERRYRSGVTSPPPTHEQALARIARIKQIPAEPFFPAKLPGAAALEAEAKRGYDTPGFDRAVRAFIRANPQRPKEAKFEWQARVCENLPPGIKHEVIFRVRERYPPVDYIVRGA